MLDLLLELDISILEFIHQQLHYPILDAFLPYWREKTTWIPLYLFIIFYTIWKERWRGLLILIALIATVGLADTMSSRVIKKQVERLRPCNDVEVKDDILLLVDCGSGYSFTSSHATNHFAIAVFVLLLWGKRFRWLPILAVTWASIISFSQVYVGVHYPLDVMAGAILGSLTAYLGFSIYRFISSRRWNSISK